MRLPIRSSIAAALAATLVLAAVAIARAGEGRPGARAGFAEIRAGDGLMLSLRVARARKDPGRVARYKSLLRQRLWKASRPSGRSTATPGR